MDVVKIASVYMLMEMLLISLYMKTCSIALCLVFANSVTNVGPGDEANGSAGKCEENVAKICEILMIIICAFFHFLNGTEISQRRSALFVP